MLHTENAHVCASDRESNNANGLSWTLDREKAVWFARRFGGDCVLKGTAKKHDVHALFNRRTEQEVVIGEFQIVLRETM